MFGGNYCSFHNLILQNNARNDTSLEQDFRNDLTEFIILGNNSLECHFLHKDPNSYISRSLLNLSSSSGIHYMARKKTPVGTSLFTLSKSATPTPLPSCFLPNQSLSLSLSKMFLSQNNVFSQSYQERIRANQSGVSTSICPLHASSIFTNHEIIHNSKILMIH